MATNGGAYRLRFYRSQDDLALHFRDYGDPNSPLAPLLCLPGITRNAHDFEHLAESLAPQRRIVCPDYRGRGRSQYDPDWRNYRPETYLGDLRQLLAMLCLERVVVIGTSLGGILAMGLSLIVPRSIAGIVINDIGPDVATGGLARILAYISADRPQPDWPSAARHLRELLPTLSLETDADWEWAARGTYRSGTDGLLHFDWDMNLAKPLAEGAGTLPDLWPLFRATQQFPTLVIRGGASDVLSEACFQRMAEVKPDMARLTLPGVGHAPTLDEPPARAALAEFLAKV